MVNIALSAIIITSMSNLDLTTPRVIFLVGIPGAGKTFFASKFSETFGAPFIDLEKIRHTVFEKPTFSGDEQHRVEAVANLAFTELLKTKRTIIYEGGLETRSSRMRLARQAREAGYRPLIIWVQTEQATAHYRATRGVRNSQQAYTISSERFNQLVSQFTVPNHLEKFIVISGKHTYPSQAKTVLSHLASIPDLTAKSTKATPAISVPERSTPARSRRISLQ